MTAPYSECQNCDAAPLTLHNGRWACENCATIYFVTRDYFVPHDGRYIPCDGLNTPCTDCAELLARYEMES